MNTFPQYFLRTGSTPEELVRDAIARARGNRAKVAQAIRAHVGPYSKFYLSLLPLVEVSK